MTGMVRSDWGRKMKMVEVITVKILPGLGGLRGARIGGVGGIGLSCKLGSLIHFNLFLKILRKK